MLGLSLVQDPLHLQDPPINGPNHVSGWVTSKQRLYIYNIY